MSRLFLLTMISALAALSAAGQDIIHYKFESGGGATEINYADPAPGVPRLGTILVQAPMTPSQAWGPGKFGGGLSAGVISQSGGAEVDTGWDGVVGPGQDFTIAFFFKAIHLVPSSSSVTMWSATGNQVFIRLRISGGGATFGQPSIQWSSPSSGLNFSLATDILTPAYSDWVHLAVVVDRTASPCHTTASWYVNGVLAQLPQSFGCLFDIPGSPLNTYRIGQKGAAFFQYDEARVSLRAVPAAEILQWATTDLAGDAPFGEACSPFGVPALLNGSGGNPFPGNAAYALTVYGLPGSEVFLGYGLSDVAFGATPLPIDLAVVNPSLAGCQFRASPDAIATGTIGATGSLPFSFPIPGSMTLVGANAYAQAVLYSPAIGTWSSTNAWAVHVGN